MEEDFLGPLGDALETSISKTHEILEGQRKRKIDYSPDFLKKGTKGNSGASIRVKQNGSDEASPTFCQFTEAVKYICKMKGLSTALVKNDLRQMMVSRKTPFSCFGYEWDFDDGSPDMKRDPPIAILSDGPNKEPQWDFAAVKKRFEEDKAKGIEDGWIVPHEATFIEDLNTGKVGKVDVMLYQHDKPTPVGWSGSRKKFQFCDNMPERIDVYFMFLIEDRRSEASKAENALKTNLSQDRHGRIPYKLSAAAIPMLDQIAAKFWDLRYAATHSNVPGGYLYSIDHLSHISNDLNEANIDFSPHLHNQSRSSCPGGDKCYHGGQDFNMKPCIRKGHMYYPGLCIRDLKEDGYANYENIQIPALKDTKENLKAILKKEKLWAKGGKKKKQKKMAM